MSNKVLIIIIIFSLLITCGLGGGLFLMWNKMSSLDKTLRPDINEETGGAEESENGVAEIGATYSLDSFITNTADPGGNRYLRVTMDLELEHEELAAELEQRSPQIRDSILMVLSAKSLQDIQNPEGKAELRQEIMTSVNGLLGKGKIANIYFTEFVIQ